MVAPRKIANTLIDRGETVHVPIDDQPTPCELKHINRRQRVTLSHKISLKSYFWSFEMHIILKTTATADYSCI